MSSHAPAAGNTHHPTMTTVLVVDDEPDLEPLINQRFRRQIRRKEMSFVYARDGVEALDRLGEDPDIGVVLSDINMPNMDGLTLLDRLSYLDRTIKAVIVSAYGDMENIRTAMNRGAFDFLTKPIDLRDLESTVNKACTDLDTLRSALAARDQLVTLQKELSDASALQQSMLTKNFDLHADCEVDARMAPARDIGGDFYDFFDVGGNRLAVVVGDVSGKGMPAALFMAITRTLLRAVAAIDPSPELCIGRVNALLCDGNETAMFVTLFYGVLDVETAEFTYVNAGHPAPYRLADGVSPVALPATGGMALGIRANAPFAENRVELKPGHGLFLFSDGISEALNVKNEEFGEQRLEAALAAAGGGGVHDVLQRVLDDVLSFAGAVPQADDICCLMLRFRSGAASTESSREQ